MEGANKHITRWEVPHTVKNAAQGPRGKGRGKQAGNYKLHRLQTIHKLESEVNLLQREIIACRLMNNVEKINYLNDDQQGRRNSSSAIDIVLGKVFTFDTTHFQRANFECTDCDAKACYDRIVPIILLLSYFKAGLPYHDC
eukprot:4668040-Ditylum_brightwellii.AAC.1